MKKLLIDRRKSVTQLRQEYKHLTEGWSDLAIQSLYSGLMEQELLLEMLTSTPVHLFISQMEKLFKSLNLRFQIDQASYQSGEEGTSAVSFAIYSEKRDKTLFKRSELEEVISRAKTLGWFPALGITGGGYAGPYNKFLKYLSDKEEDDPVVTDLIHVFEPKYSIQHQFDPNKYYYHITSNLAYDKIKNIGLLPKEKSKLTSFPARVYVLETTKPLEKSHIQYLSDSLLKTTYDRGELVDTAYVFEIDKSYLSKRKLFIDPNFPGYDSGSQHVRGIFTPEPIAPSALKVFLTFKL